jgi:hypothetical protein
MKKLTIFIILVAFFVAFANEISAKRILPRAKTQAKVSSQTTTARRKGISSSVKIRNDRKALDLTLSNFTDIESVSYILSYDSNGVTQGVSGAITDEENTVTRDLIFGTCSDKVCRYDTNITNARLTITTTLKSGLVVIKPYKIKI